MSNFRAERQTVLETCLHLSERGFLPATGGNVAIRAGDSAFAVTPSALDYRSMVAEDICVLDLKTLERLEGERKPSVESGLHARLLRFRTDFQASIHTHQPIASAVTLLGSSLPVEDSDDRATLGVCVPLVPYAPSGTSFLARAFGRSLRPDASAYLLKNHGIVCGGRSIEEAIENVERLERLAANWLRERIRNASAPRTETTDYVMSALESAS